MEFIEDINIKEYEEFVRNNEYKSHFMQSYYWGEVMKMKNFIPHYVGLKKDGNLVATALLLEKRLIGKYCYLYCPRGYVWNYNNFELLETFTNKLKIYAKKINALFIKIDPDIKLHDLDLDGNIKEGNNYKLVEKLEKLGYKNKGYNKNFINEQPRFTFRLNLNDDFDNIYKNMHPTTRKILNKGNAYDLNLYIGDTNDINAFYDTMVETAKRENLHCTPISYYKHFYETLNKQGMSDLYVVKVDINHLKEKYKNKINNIENEINSIDETKYKNKQKLENKLKDLNNELDKAKKELDNLQNIKEEILTLSSIITVKYNDKVWTIHGGNHTLLRELNANYLLYYTIIKDAYDNGYKMVDFFGTSGEANPDKSNPIYGIHLFKKRLGGEYTEFIGEYDLIINKPVHFLYKKLLPIYRKLKK